MRVVKLHCRRIGEQANLQRMGNGQRGGQLQGVKEDAKGETDEVVVDETGADQQTQQTEGEGKEGAKKAVGDAAQP